MSLRVSDADRNGTMRRLHNAVALGLIDIDEFEERRRGCRTRGPERTDGLVGDLPGPGAIVTSAADRVELRGWVGSLKRQGEWTVPTRLALVRRIGLDRLDLTKARFAGPVVVIGLDMKFGSLDLRLPDGASASIDDVEVYVGSASDRRKDAPAEGNAACVLTGRVRCAARWSSAVRGKSKLGSGVGRTCVAPIQLSRVARPALEWAGGTAPRPRLSSSAGGRAPRNSTSPGTRVDPARRR